jgi:hypothetical protein
VEPVTIPELLTLAGGDARVAKALGYSPHTVYTWRYGTRTVPKSGKVRDRLCRLARVSPADVEWTKAARAADRS